MKCTHHLPMLSQYFDYTLQVYACALYHTRWTQQLYFRTMNFLTLIWIDEYSLVYNTDGNLCGIWHFSTFSMSNFNQFLEYISKCFKDFWLFAYHWTSYIIMTLFVYATIFDMPLYHRIHKHTVSIYIYSITIVSTYTTALNRSLAHSYINSIHTHANWRIEWYKADTIYGVRDSKHSREWQSKIVEAFYTNNIMRLCRSKNACACYTYTGFRCLIEYFKTNMYFLNW